MKKLHTIIILLAAILCLGLTAATASAGGQRHQPTVQLAFLPPPPFLAPFFYGRDRGHYRDYDPPRRDDRDRHHRRDHRYRPNQNLGDEWTQQYPHLGNGGYSHRDHRDDRRDRDHDRDRSRGRGRHRR